MYNIEYYKASRIAIKVIAFELKQALCKDNIMTFWHKKYKTKAKSLILFYKVVKKKIIEAVIEKNLKLKRNILHLDDQKKNWPNHRILKDYRVSKKDRIVLFALYSPNGSFTQLQKRIIEDYERLGYKVIAIMASENIEAINLNNIPSCAGITIVENKYFDFCSWAIGIHRFAGIESCAEVILTNDSVAPRQQKLDLISNTLTNIRRQKVDVSFLTESKEVNTHGQSYFIHVSKSGIEKGVLNTFKRGHFFQSKTDLIKYIEVQLLDSFRLQGLYVDCMYKATTNKNPTLDGWDLLCRQGFPFIKVSALGFASKKVSRRSINRHLDKEMEKLILEHLTSRNNNYLSQARHSKLQQHFYNEIGALVSPCVYPQVVDLGCKEIIDGLNIAKGKLFTCILHAFYPDIAIELIGKLEKLKIKYNLIITTDSIEKKATIARYCNKKLINARIFVYENKGRDILPLLTVAREVELENHPILHLHTKKSPHDEELKYWSESLFNSLVGSKSRTLSCIDLINNSSIGLIYPEFYKRIENQINWGYDYTHASFLTNMLKISINKDDYLTFPAGSMLWIEKSVLKKLANISWCYDDFEQENGQIDGTLAHAFERIFVHATLNMGKEYVQVSSLDPEKGQLSENNSSTKRDYMFETVKDLRTWGTSYVGPRLKAKLKSFLASNKGLTYEVDIVSDGSSKKYLNLVVPTIEIEKIYGGLSTAFKVAKEIYDKQNFDGLRVIVTTDNTSSRGVENLSKYFNTKFDLLQPSASRDLSLHQVCNLYDSGDRVLRVAKDDIFMATAWWTASISKIIMNNQKNVFDTNHNLIYLIQDYECGFYQWGDSYIQAKNTYCSKNTIAIINSLPLYNFLRERFEFRKSFLLPYSLNAALNEKLLSLDERINDCRENIILCYARPSTPRNCFETIKDAISMWQKTSRIQEDWKVLFIGESFDSNLINNLSNCECLGKLSLENYSDLLAKAKIGISLMVSPHPSYPPLEMASFGMKVITNKYESKNLSDFNNNIYSLEEVSPATISTLLDELSQANDFSIKKYVETPDEATLIFPQDFSL